MKKLIVFLVICVLSLTFIGCGTQILAYDVAFNTNGHGEQPEVLIQITELPELPVLQEEGYQFTGWYYDEAFLVKAEKGQGITDNITLFGQWKKLCKIEFENNGHGSKPDPITDVTSIPNLPALEEEGYVFGGWFLDDKLITPATTGSALENNIKVYAKWDEKTYTIEFDNKGHGSKPDSITDVTTIPELPVLQEESYRFIGWYTDEAFVNKAEKGQSITDNITLIACWEELYKIEFEINGHGSKPDSISDVMAIPELSTLEENGYIFGGWYLDEELTQVAEEGASISKNTTLYAKWTLLEGFSYVNELDETMKKNLSVDGYAQTGITDFTQYVNTSYYRTVSTPLEFLQAILDAKVEYTNTWNEETKTVDQTLIKEGSVHVIEILNDLNLGYFKLGSAEKATNLVSDYANKMNNLKPYLCMSDMLLENGMSQIKIENISNLLIYSKNGAKLTHCGFKLTSDTNVVFRNLQFDELWQWEDAPVKTSSKIGDYDWFGWAYFKISFCGFIWIDHCTFGKSYDGQIDYSNPVYNANAGTAFRAPYGATGENGLHISWCKFNSGSADPSGYLYKMMAQIEQEYQEGKKNYLYYNALRDANISFEDILYGIAIPQKKGFLCGDDAKFSGSYDNADDYNFNLKLKVSFANCLFKNIEDRLPKLRGGNAYLYNCVVDSSEYYTYRGKLLAQNAKSIVARVKSDWKCALVSQGIVCGNGGSVKAENTIFRGIETLLKHNDTKNVSPYVDGGFELTNCSYQRSITDQVYTGSSSDPNTIFVSSIPSKLNQNNFSWKTANNEPPFQITQISLEKLEAILQSQCGTSSEIKQMFLKKSYA